VQKVISEAKGVGYKNIFLDTLPFLNVAIAMYKNYGFMQIDSYNNNPMEGLLYWKYALSESE